MNKPRKGGPEPSREDIIHSASVKKKLLCAFSMMPCIHSFLKATWVGKQIDVRAFLCMLSAWSFELQGLLEG